MYYTIPIQLSHLIAGQHAPTSTLTTSIQEQLELLLLTFPMEYTFDPAYGNVLYEYQHQVPSPNETFSQWRKVLSEKIRANIERLMKVYEPRFMLSEVVVTFTDPKLTASEAFVQVHIEIMGQSRLTITSSFPLRIPVIQS